MKKFQKFLDSINKIFRFLVNFISLDYNSLRGGFLFIIILFFLLFAKMFYYEMIMRKIYNTEVNYNSLF